MESASALVVLATVYYACRDQDTLLKTFAARLGANLGARAVLVWLASDSGDLTCRTRWTEPGERLAPVPEPVSEGLLVDVAKSGQARRISSKEIDAAELAHLEEDHRQRVRNALYCALPSSRGVAGVVEVLNKHAGDFTAGDEHFCQEATHITGLALSLLTTIDEERHSQLSTVERLTSLYDLSRIFTSTLELGELVPIVAGKLRDILGAQACNLWLVDSGTNELYLAEQAGEDPTVSTDARAPLGEGFLGETAQQGSPRLVEDPASEPSLVERLKAGGDFEIRTLMCAPLLKDNEAVGVVELVNKLDGTSFDEEDLFFLSSVSEQAAVALHNANLLESERKVHVLDALLKISQEITSTLDLDHVLTTVVHQAATVVPFDRCIIGFFDRNRFVIGAVSGEKEVPKSREMDQLRDVLEWVAQQSEPVAADQYEEGWEVKPEGARVQIVRTLEEQDCSGFYALPLRDDQGTLGALALLSGDAEFLTDTQRETVSILANQTTVAIRNAQLYQQVPLMSLLQPLAERKQRLMAAMPYSRLVDIAWKVGLAALLLTVVPWKMRVSANATVVPAERRIVSAQVGGVVRGVLVHEGDVVTQDQVLAQLDDSDDRVKLAQAQTRLALARRDLADAEFRRDLTAAGQARLRSQLHEAEVSLEEQRVDHAQLRASIAGLVVTPKVEEKAGTLLKTGDPFCELVEQDRMAVDMNVPEAQMDLIRPGTHVSFKLNALPTMTLSGTVQRVGARAITAEEEQFFVVRAVFQNPGRQAREGMAGKARITAAGGWFESGWYPVGYLLFRSPFRWIWQKAWGWLP
jgi:GAF domain-containing protein